MRRYAKPVDASLSEGSMHGSPRGCAQRTVRLRAFSLATGGTPGTTYFLRERAQ